jgi:hypothetical protein
MLLTSAHAATFDVNIGSPQFTLYSDPYNGNEIKLGGFSGLYPVPGRPDCFYAITDRGPAPDFTDADGKLYKTSATVSFAAFCCRSSWALISEDVKGFRAGFFSGFIVCKIPHFVIARKV